jgi:hypothetical protein
MEIRGHGEILDFFPPACRSRWRPFDLLSEGLKMNTNSTICCGRAFETKMKVDQLRRKILKETERYLNEPLAESWGRLGDFLPAKKFLEKSGA